MSSSRSSSTTTPTTSASSSVRAAPESACRSCPASCRSPTGRRSSASRRAAAIRCRPGSTRRASARAPSCSARARRASTSTRSTARRRRAPSSRTCAARASSGADPSAPCDARALPLQPERMSVNDLEKHVRALLHAIDPDPEREGLARTPERVARGLAFLTKGHEEDPRRVINGALFREEYSEMIVVKDIDFYSLCEHHVLPFFGKAHVAYLPNGRIVGIS